MTLPEHENLLLIGAREPVAGEAKTRLGATIGMERAAQLYRAFLADLAHRFVPNGEFTPDYQFGWGFTPATDRFRSIIDELGPVSSNGHALFVPQDGEDWGIRQLNLLRWGADHHFARTVLTASDSPQMSRCAVERAFELLHEADVVIGRVHDGGYYLIGMRGFHDVRTGVPMSTQSAAEALVARAESLGLRVAEVPGTFDIDVEADLDLLIELLDERPEAAHATSQALRALNLIPDRQAAGDNRRRGC
jgi:glycosyltransferase A (GT-A) superfamily protein (DUF2064 family)